MNIKICLTWNGLFAEQHGYKADTKGVTGMELNNMDILSDEICDVNWYIWG